MTAGRQPSRLAEAVVSVAQDAGAAILEVYDGPIDVQTKDDSSPLTLADLRAHQTIVGGLEALGPAWAPQLPIRSEESSSGDVAALGAADYWLVDPLDGTREFVRRNGEFTVNIARVVGGRAVLGVVLAPVTGAVWVGEVNHGAWHRPDPAQGWQPLEAEPPPAPLAGQGGLDPLRVVVSRSHASDALQRLLGDWPTASRVPCGSSLKLCRLATRDADVYPRLGPTSHWDIAAAHAVLKAAGGAVVDAEGVPLRYVPGEEVLNPARSAARGSCPRSRPLRRSAVVPARLRARPDAG